MSDQDEIHDIHSAEEVTGTGLVRSVPGPPPDSRLF